MDTYKGQDNDTLRELCSENNCDVVTVPNNLTGKFQPLDLSGNKTAKSFIQNKYNDWFAGLVSKQLQNRTGSTDVQIVKTLSCKMDCRLVQSR